jgi:FkbM family methyltransferase
VAIFSKVGENSLMVFDAILGRFLELPGIWHFRMRRSARIRMEERLELELLELERLELERLELERLEKSYRVGSFLIELSPGHLLHEYQSVHPFYDKFPLFITKFLPEATYVIEVGANVGDTLASMVTGNSALNYICIEADSDFFQYLDTNIKSMQSLCKFNVEALNVMVAQEIKYRSLEGLNGTKKGIEALLDDNFLSTVSLDCLFEKRENSTVSLLVVDVDGFDFDVIKSARNIIELSAPILFFESTPLTEQNTEKYLKLMGDLESTGYLHWTVFDNFGNLILHDVPREIAAQVLIYSLIQNLGKGTRSIWYLDIYCCTEKYLNEYENSIIEYKKFMSN